MNFNVGKISLGFNGMIVSLMLNAFSFFLNILSRLVFVLNFTKIIIGLDYIRTCIFPLLIKCCTKSMLMLNCYSLTYFVY